MRPQKYLGKQQGRGKLVVKVVEIYKELSMSRMNITCSIRAFISSLCCHEGFSLFCNPTGINTTTGHHRADSQGAAETLDRSDRRICRQGKKISFSSLCLISPSFSSSEMLYPIKAFPSNVLVRYAAWACAGSVSTQAVSPLL